MLICLMNPIRKVSMNYCFYKKQHLGKCYSSLLEIVAGP